MEGAYLTGIKASQKKRMEGGISLRASRMAGSLWETRAYRSGAVQLPAPVNSTKSTEKPEKTARRGTKTTSFL